MTYKAISLLGVGLIALTAGCAQMEPEPIYAQPVFDKYGNPSCRPGDVPVGGVYTADLPICAIVPGEAADAMAVASDPAPGAVAPVLPPVEPPVEPPVDPPVDPTGNQNRNQNQNQNTTNTQTQTGQ
ncbi:MAG: hypothetical protein HKO95_02625 [Rhodobacteraceae bacterium]|nr:hypothetical protein [Alphaproteobacteria bacterium]MBT8475333.1 hypothetical protein [Alphaproteobacteria bacterium]NNF71964.1 hypothetical protein [Paracoccaceae bacterium]NNK65612.1 hypothetical protein [Paracoccaceae bacterium]